VVTLPTPAEARAVRRTLRGTVGLVPTMGALHRGHISLIARAAEQCDVVAVSIFVNPLQFGDPEDIAHYPRTLEADLAVCAEAGAHVVFAPTVSEMYPAWPDPPATAVSVRGLTENWEGASRPGHFDGVATVVAKLLIQCTPDFAMFGEKDYQQLKVVNQMANDLDLPVTIIGLPTVREKDGLAMSSRNAYLTVAERMAAPMLYRVLKECAGKIGRGQLLPRVLDEGGAALERAGFMLDYLEARNAETLATIDRVDKGSVRLLAAARLGRTRLIDNVAV